MPSFLIRLLSKFHLVVKIAIFGIFSCKLFDHMRTYWSQNLQLNLLKIINFFKQSEFRKKSIFIKRFHIQHVRYFWRQCPALLYGLSCYLATLAVLAPSWVVLIPLVFLCTAGYRRGMLALGCGLVTFGLVSHSVQIPSAEHERIGGVVTVEVEDISHETRYKKPIISYRVKVIEFQTQYGHFQNFSCKMAVSGEKGRLQSGMRYTFPAVLKQHHAAIFSLTPQHSAIKMTESGGSFSLVDIRFHAKRGFSRFLARVMPPGEARSFLEGCMSGSFQDVQLVDALKRFGLQHITVVSGFHFSLVAAIIAFCLGPLISWRSTYVVLLVITTLYFLFVGPSPSVLRAYISLVLTCVAALIGRKSIGLNNLGIGLLVVLAYDPTYSLQLAFQLSFLATFSILLVYPSMTRWIASYTSSFSLKQLLHQGFIDQTAYILRSFFIDSLALIFSVHLMVVPVLLYVYHNIPLAGIVYNCFFPFLVSLGLFFTAACLMLSWIPFVSTWLFNLLYHYLDMLLGVILYAPRCVDVVFHVESVSALSVTIVLCAVSYMGMAVYEQDDAHAILKWI